MKKINVVIILLAGIFTMIFLGIMANAGTAGNAVMPDNEVVRDEGYGNSDAEYYNSADDLTNDEEISINQEDFSNNAR